MPAILDSAFRMKYGSMLPGGEEQITYALFDTVTYTSASSTNITFFNAVRTDKTKSNMEVAGQLAAPKYFVIFAIRLVPYTVPSVQNTTTQTTAIINLWRDVFRLMFLSRFVLTIGSKTYTNMPGHMFPAGSGVSGFGAGMLFGVTTANKDFVMHASNGTPDIRNVYSLNRPRLIEPQINFQADLFWNAAVTLDAGDTEVQTILDGTLYRPIQ